MRNGRERSRTSRAPGETTLVLVCAAAAGAHAGLVPAHLNDEPRLGIATNTVEALGVIVALWLIHPVGRQIRPNHLQEVSR